MNTASWTLRRLDAETRSLHAEADERWMALLHSSVTLREYVAQLERSYGFIAPYDAALAYTPNLPLRPRVRTTLLVRDLLTLGRSPLKIATLPMCLEIDLTCPLAALGWIYVVERSALIHGGLLRHLRHRLPIAGACTFLAADATPFGPAWEDLGRALDAANELDQTALDKIVAGAREAFHVQQAWFEEGEFAERSYA